MSFHVLLDRHPGRCQNYRSHMHPDGHIETLRCLNYEAERHVCEFPEPTHLATRWTGSTGYSSSSPEPWVKP